ncbi:MAG: carboxypeptidase M32 [Clostridia bacterium]
MKEYKNTQEAVAELKKMQERMAAYSHASGMLYYDSVTGAPKETTEGRGHTMGIISEDSYRILVNEDTPVLLDYLIANNDQLDENTKLEVKELKKDYDETSKIPVDEYVQYSILLNEAENIWHKAKIKSDYAMFEPYLAKIVATTIRFAGYLDPKKKPYDVWLNEFEEDLTMEVADRYFETLRAELVPLIKKVAKSKVKIDDSFSHKNYALNKQRKFSDYIMNVMTIDRDHCAIAETEHPFTINFNKNDVRITTHYIKDNLVSSMFSVIHEGGHALYELNGGDEFMYTCLSGGTSMGIHESQSRFFENIIGRSEGFTGFLYPYLKKLFPSQFKDVTKKMLLLAINKAEPSLIRTEADELTYSMHIMIRYELEKKMISGELSTKDLPAEWNRLYKEYLGVDVPNDKEGCLQDSHWSGGAIGYFPSYSLGNAYSAQMLNAMKKDLNVDALTAKGDLKPIVEWLKEHVHKYSSSKKPPEIIRICCNEDFEPHYYTDYLKEKFSRIYELKD